MNWSEKDLGHEGILQDIADPMALENLIKLRYVPKSKKSREDTQKGVFLSLVISYVDVSACKQIIRATLHTFLASGLWLGYLDDPALKWRYSIGILNIHQAMKPW